MSILVSGLRLPYEQAEASALKEACRRCGVKPGQAQARIYKRSFDLRHGKLSQVFSVLLELEPEQEARILQQNQDPNIRQKVQPAAAVPSGEIPLEHRPVVVGCGPAGLFAALILAENGYCPLVLERGDSLDRRDQAVARFEQTGQLDEDSNIQFGEGGAGAYSDGKLTTRIHDPRCELALQKLLQAGAPPEVAQQAKPHIGTDLLKGVVGNLRRRMEQLGGQVLFRSPMTGIRRKNGRLEGLETPQGFVPCQVAVLAVGHSARPVFQLLADQQFTLERKAFSVGARVEHLQQDINRGRYGIYAQGYGLPPAEYTLSYRKGDRACYSFCMCPGGQVAAAASQVGGVVTNGMSYHARDGRNANAALAVSVLPEDFGGSDPLAGMHFQRRLEQTAFQLGGGDYGAPVQLYGDLKEGRVSAAFGRVQPTYPRGTAFADLRQALPPFVIDYWLQAMPVFGRQLPGFDQKDTLFTGVETRTSSPVRIVRGQDFFAPGCQGLIPCGEGAGYAGGIISAAVDGIRAAERILQLYRPWED